MDFILPTAYQIPVLNNGATIKLYGWRADNGLYGIFPTTPPGPLPDVIVTSLSYDPATGLFSSVMKNQGAAATPAGVTLGVSYSVDGVSQTWGTVMGPLAAGASVTIKCGGGAYAIPSGTHTITAFADDLNRFAETNETNNTLSQSVTIAGSNLPDLIVTSLSYVPATGLFTSVVTNQNPTATPAGVTIGSQYSVDGVSRTWGTVMGPLAAGASVTIKCEGGAYAIPSGTHTITAVADAPNRIVEANETNNMLSKTITIP
jgi:subtilase family serine protease